MKNKEFTKEQKRLLAILHQDIDNYMIDFYYENSRYITKTVIGKKKTRNSFIEKRLYQMPIDKLRKVEEDMKRFKNELYTITKGVDVLGVDNKLLVPLDNVAYYKISNTVNCTTKNIPLRKILQSKEILEETLKENNYLSDGAKAKLSIHQEVIDFCVKNNLEHICRKNEHSQIMLYAYDENQKRIIETQRSRTGIYFKNGIILPTNAKEVLHLKQNKPILPLQEKDKRYINENTYFIVNYSYYRNQEYYLRSKEI